MENSKINFVTRNSNKFNEVYDLFQKENIKFDLIQSNIETTEIQANSCRDVAIFKLNSIREKLDGSFFIEDAGFFVDSPLNGFPGVYSSYIFKSIGNKGILKLIDDFENSKAHFTAVIALYFQPTNKIFIFEGIVKGKVSDKIKGNQGFGFDPIFIPNEIPDKTFGELSLEKKNAISHRGKAFKQIVDVLTIIHKL